MNPLALQSYEKKTIKTVLWFANLKSIRSTKQIEEKFSKLPLVPSLFKSIPASEVFAYENDQERLSNLLRQITQSEKSRNIVSLEVCEMLRNKIQEVQLDFSHRQITTRFGLTGVEAVMAYGLALILDNRYNITARLQQCGNPNCKRFNLDLEPKGRPKKHCGKKCKDRADAVTGSERVKRSRRKGKELSKTMKI